MRNIYIFNMTSRSIHYGIGTYIRQLIRSARYARLKVHYVLISDEIKEFEVREKDGVCHLNIPLTPSHLPNYLVKTEESVAYSESILSTTRTIYFISILCVRKP